MSARPPLFDRGQAERFLTLLDESAESFCFQTFDDGRTRKDNKLARVLHGTLSQHWAALCKLSDLGAGIFVAVNRTNGQGRKREDITAVRSLWLELDRQGTPELPIEPHIVVESSPGKFHKYLLVNESQDFELFNGLMRRLVLDYGSDANAADVSRVLRLPGFPHQKQPDSPWLVRIIHESGQQPYSMEEIARVIPPIARVQGSEPLPEGHGIGRLAEVRSALAALDADMPYGEWVDVGMALHHATGGSAEGLALWDSFSATGTLYRPGECLDKYRTFGRQNGHPVTLRTIFSMASATGWRWVDNSPPLGEPATPNETNNEPRQFPTLNAEALHGILGEVVKLCTQDSEVDGAAILFTFSTWYGAAVGNGPRVLVGDTAHCARLFTLLVGNTSHARKGSSKAPVQKIMNAAQGLTLSLPGPTLPRLKPVLRVDGPLSSGEGLIYAVRDEQFDAKGELEDAGVKDKRLFVLEGEFGAAFRCMQREGNTLSTTLRCAWDIAQPWEALKPMTKTSRIAATNPHICITGHITEAELSALLSGVDIHNGMANRLLWVCVRRQGLVALPKPLDEDAVHSLGMRIAARLKAAQELERPIALTGAARALWIESYAELSADRPGAYGAATSRAEAQAIRLALIYALLDGADYIDEGHLKAALAAVDYCNESARYLFGGKEGNPAMDKVLDALREGPKSQTELFGLFDRHLSQAKLRALLEQLQGAGRITCQVQKTTGRPSTVWRLLK